MLHLAKYCSSRLLPQCGQIFNSKIPQVAFRCNNRQLFQNARKRPNLSNSIKNSKLFKLFATEVVKSSAQNSCAQYKKAVGYWLLSCSGMVFVAVVLGGVTRLTESGLSMVTWKLLGEKMPRTEEEWILEFKKYQDFPEFKIKNKDMTLAEFKRIWYMEYIHRMWGRAIGAVYLLPAGYFWARGAFSRLMKIRVLAFGTLIGIQGLMGWYMVKSGLEDRFHGESDVPRVSQYRLASHLSLAFILYSLLLWSSLDHLLPADTLTNVSCQTVKAARRFRMFAHTCKGMVFFTAVSGAFIAGLDAGLVYNSFPKMADRWVPSDIFAHKPVLINFTENPATVQFTHRIFGLTTFILITTLWLLSKRKTLPRRAYFAANAIGAMVWVQVALGISTLLMYVPIPLAASHQCGSLTLLSIAVWLTHELKRLPKI